MADIALLVVEEFERRKRLEDDGVEKESVGLKLSSVKISSLGRKIGRELSSIKEAVGARKVELVSRDLEPRSPFSVAALDGLFSS